MKVKKGIKWLKRDFMEQLKQFLKDNHVVDLGGLVKFKGREQFIQNLLIREELVLVTDNDIEQQLKIDCTRKATALKHEKHRDKLKEEETALRVVMGL